MYVERTMRISEMEKKQKKETSSVKIRLSDEQTGGEPFPHGQQRSKIKRWPIPGSRVAKIESMGMPCAQSASIKGLEG